ncbi:LOW QUALITY PROTEIN: hypothetical protein Cgig2_014324 [Carnegiea gigantea]|uniref:Uncharacterized protein n=1 Tax=Carnegiea gigantea TaxID=171969 RepID=A0A9Q1GI87_9CARY|nr:LOW QUALITY PROTEIN: hypothetical protein Cgig2_014324 [Carnegiea gigantea]
MIIKCWEPKKALHELADKRQIDCFLKRGPRFLRKEREPMQPKPRDEEFSTEIQLSPEDTLRASLGPCGKLNSEGPSRFSPLSKEVELHYPQQYSGHHPSGPPNPRLQGIGGKPYRNESSSFTLWTHSEGKEFGGGLLSRGRPYGLQHHPRVAHPPQGRYDLRIGKVSARPTLGF